MIRKIEELTNKYGECYILSPVEKKTLLDLRTSALAGASLIVGQTRVGGPTIDLLEKYTGKDSVIMTYCDRIEEPDGSEESNMIEYTRHYFRIKGARPSEKLEEYMLQGDLQKDLSSFIEWSEVILPVLESFALNTDRDISVVESTAKGIPDPDRHVTIYTKGRVRAFRSRDVRLGTEGDKAPIIIQRQALCEINVKTWVLTPDKTWGWS